MWKYISIIRRISKRSVFKSERPTRTRNQEAFMIDNNLLDSKTILRLSIDIVHVRLSHFRSINKLTCQLLSVQYLGSLFDLPFRLLSLSLIKCAPGLLRHSFSPRRKGASFFHSRRMFDSFPALLSREGHNSCQCTPLLPYRWPSCDSLHE
jgi:hypothetical protein